MRGKMFVDGGVGRVVEGWRRRRGWQKVYPRRAAKRAAMSAWAELQEAVC